MRPVRPAKAHRPLPRESTGKLARALRSQTLWALIGTLVAIALFTLGALALDWWVYHDRYRLGFFDYLRTFVF